MKPPKVAAVGSTIGSISTKTAPSSPDFERQKTLAETIMREGRNVLHALAK